MKFFKYDNENGFLSLNDESILLISEFRELMETERNRSFTDPTGLLKERAFKEFSYIYLYIDWESPYFKLPEQEKHTAALSDSQLSDAEFNDPVFRNACKKYEALQDSAISIRLLKAAMASVETVIYYLTHVDVNERNDADGKPIYKTKDLIAEIKGSKDLILAIKELEKQVKEDLEQQTGLRGNVEAGFFD